MIQESRPRSAAGSLLGRRRTLAVRKRSVNEFEQTSKAFEGMIQANVQQKDKKSKS